MAASSAAVQSGGVTPGSGWQTPLPEAYSTPAEVKRGVEVINDRLQLVASKLQELMSREESVEKALIEEKVNVREEIKKTQQVAEKSLAEHSEAIKRQFAEIQVTRDTVVQLMGETRKQ